MTIARALVRSACQSWCTPPEILAVVRAVAPIGLDPCSNPSAIVAARVNLMLERGDDGLAAGWADLLAPGEIAYVNPPFGRAIPAWVEKCIVEHRRGASAILQLPARTDTRWWRAAMEVAAAVAFWRGRPRYLEPAQTLFGEMVGRGGTATSPFPVALIYFGARAVSFVQVAQAAGHWAIHRDGWRSLSGGRGAEPPASLDTGL